MNRQVDATVDLSSQPASGDPGHQPGVVSDAEHLSLLEERLEVDKRPVETGRVRVDKSRHERRVEFDVPLVRETAEVRKVVVNRVVERPVPVRREGDVLIVSVHKEVPVVTVQLIVTEELHIAVDRHEELATQAATLAHEEFDIQRTSSDGFPERSPGQPAGRAFQPGSQSPSLRLEPRTSQRSFQQGRFMMEMTLIGVFRDFEQAREARERLKSEGIDESMTRLTSAEDSLQAPASPEEHHGFFARLFGLDETDEHVGDYSEAVRRGSALLSVHLQDEGRVEQVRRLLEQCGATDIDRRVEQWEAGGYRGYDPLQTPYSASEAAAERETFKVMEEELKVGKRAVEGGGVRVHPRLREKPVTEEVMLHEERAVVERRPVDRPASQSELEAFGSNTDPLEIREMREEAVVSKSARVVEEVSVGKQATDRKETINETLRRTDVDIEQLDATGEQVDKASLQDAARRKQETINKPGPQTNTRI